MTFDKTFEIRWRNFSLAEQMANIGADIGRAINWREKDKKTSRLHLEKGLELLDFTITDPKNRRRLKELLRVREALADYFYFENIYKSSDQLWNNYFYAFNYAARNK
ncbi:MAG: hypothetical protein Q8Q48_02580 [Candidatus Staskawiczbacteria bacterium]|nr:hypothetical protein [Candidatus Staskawiczbacteria bacterium]